MRLILLLPLLGLCLVSLGQEKKCIVNGISYHVFMKGFESRKDKTPAIIFESGLGVDLGNWNKVIDQISSFAPVFAYERAGVGKSDKSFTMPTPKYVSENLHNILKSLKINPPYILVGHSLGGVYIRSFAGFFPDEIAGLVFIDPADFTESKEDWNNIFRKMNLPEKKIDEMLYDRLYKQNSKVDSVNFGPRSEITVLTELRKTDFNEISVLPLPDVPILFFVGGKFDVPLSQRSKDFDQETFFHIKNASNMERWKKLIYSSSKGGSIIFLTKAGHYIQWDDPKSIVSNVKLLVESLE